MANNRYYYYDHDACTFVEVRPKRRNYVGVASIILLASVALTLISLWVLSSTVGSPQELALRTENRALIDQLEATHDRMSQFTSQLDALFENDRDLYRTIFYADPIPDDIRALGVGGADVYETFNMHSAAAGAVLRRTSEQLDRLERQIGLQSNSFKELFQLAREREDRLGQLPAIMPTDGLIVSGHGARIHPIYRSARMHHGIDIVVDVGTPVHATADGVVTFAGSSPGYGINIRIRHAKTGYTTLYAHLSSLENGLRRGSTVQRGDLIGLSGDTGTTTGPHLHYEVRDEQGNSLNPIHFFAPSMTPEEYQRVLETADASVVSLD